MRRTPSEHGDTSLYVTLIGDIRGSRELDDQQAFKDVVGSLDEQISRDSIKSPATVTTGDEFQVRLTDAAAAVEAAVAASDRFHPTKFRFGIGRGELDTPVTPGQAICMDGPCVHRARDAIDVAERSRSGFSRRITSSAPRSVDRLRFITDHVLYWCMVSPEEHIQEFVEVTQPNKSFEEITKVNRTDGDVHIHFEMGTDSVTEISYARLTEDDDEYTVAEFEIQGQNEDDSQTSDGTDVDSPIDRLRQYLDTSYPESDLEEVTNLERTGDTTHIHVDVTDESGTEQYYAMITEDDDTYRIEEFKTV